MFSVLGCDYSKDKPDLHQLWDLGYRWLGLYLWPYTEATATKGKGASPAYVAKARSIGFSILPLYEGWANGALGGAKQAGSDITQALLLADSWDMPARAPIVGVNVDFDASPAELAGPVRDYATVWHDRLGPQAWGYGGIRSLAYLFDHGLIGDALHAYAWSGGEWDPRASFRQQHNAQAVAGGNIDIGHATPAGVAKIWIGEDMPLTKDDAQLVADTLLNATNGPKLANLLWNYDPGTIDPDGTVHLNGGIAIPTAQPDAAKNVTVRPSWLIAAIANKIAGGEPLSSK